MMLTPDPMRPLVALADDDEIHAEVVSVWLAHHGFDVVKFGTGDELLAWAQAIAGRLPDAVLLDVEMPGRDGFEVHAELRRLPSFTATPMAFVSGMPPESLQSRAGANTALNKDEHLLPKLSAWLATTIV
jgi:CheY-like chemotaxis protein